MTTATPSLTESVIAADRAPLVGPDGQLPQDLHIEWRSIAAIRAYPDNPRNNQPAIVDVRNSLITFGWQQPIVVDGDGIIVVGHTRYYAALDLQQKQVPVYPATHLTPQQARAYRIADNKIHERSGWDIPKLATELRALDDLGVDLRLTGFRDFEWKPIIGSEWTPGGDGGSLGGERDTMAEPPMKGLLFSEEERVLMADALQKYRETESEPSADLRSFLLYLARSYLDG